ncbi:DNA alkylation repair protein [Spirilliplanes yamanashiensis]|uniref:DNA alkylation repair protein n=1 Tax=Spirilliplanes yamanashiensis TaxID=42233 RepID=A0A8J3Y5S3_9ACTN|nr:DNA alkylation repair protein [Spirilliplanes yamanashiensis]MDP9819262.1 3-methyladenine DNA glycosylase AlkD [Spirilliplanes yamanashiensis]GIJ01914.1 hypothetical protein Sya03_12660 [Spirilliplanes yamanashiensis]
MPDLPDLLLARLTSAFPAAADPAKAAPMAAYMQHRFPFLGLSAPGRRAAARAALAGLPAPGPAELAAVARGCWALPEREYQQFACDYLVRHARLVEAPLLRELVTTRSWWDTVDALATRVAGVAAAPAELDAWALDDDRWLVRTAILHQLHRGAATDTARLFGYCTAQAGHPDFFVRKAIGWALRQYARTDPDAVRGYLAAHPELSALSRREASRHL